MLDQITALIKDQAIAAFTNETEVPNEQAAAAAEATGASIFETLTSQISSGNVSALTSLLGIGETAAPEAESGSNAIVQAISGTLISKLSDLGLSEGTAQTAANSVVPSLISQVVKRFTSSDPQDAEFDVNTLIQNVMQESGQNMVKDQMKNMLGDQVGGMLSGFFGS